MLRMGHIECKGKIDFQIEMPHEFQNRELELDLGVRMKIVAFISKETTSLSSQPHVHSFIIRLYGVEVQDRAYVGTRLYSGHYLHRSLSYLAQGLKR